MKITRGKFYPPLNLKLAVTTVDKKYFIFYWAYDDSGRWVPGNTIVKVEQNISSMEDIKQIQEAIANELGENVYPRREFKVKIASIQKLKS